MPPKPKFTKDEMVQAALELVARRGTEALTARELGAALGSSARPIFTVFRSMDELQQAVREAAMRRFEQFVRQPVPGMPVFKQVGMQMARFAVEEPKLYQLLFMQENAGAAGFSGMVRILGSTADTCMEAIRRDYGLEPDEARMLFENVWIYTFGVGALCATNACRFSPEELGQMLTTEFSAMMCLVKSGNFRKQEGCDGMDPMP